ncbi:hypothetical protein C8F04DRAFT_630544 [Mycena alexandri]|uniref:Uncharacterized protein n=1 Tax=Mycena alexandri TaxID=1745969 RepID=A0AAD6STF9_9AGAR|nr:hypothetical protein C8F04DRAFT_630544 [Mycena alexandri]
MLWRVIQTVATAVLYLLVNVGTEDISTSIQQWRLGDAMPILLHGSFDVVSVAAEVVSGFTSDVAVTLLHVYRPVPRPRRASNTSSVRQSKAIDGGIGPPFFLHVDDASAIAPLHPALTLHTTPSLFPTPSASTSTSASASASASIICLRLCLCLCLRLRLRLCLCLRLPAPSTHGLVQPQGIPAWRCRHPHLHPVVLTRAVLDQPAGQQTCGAGPAGTRRDAPKGWWRPRRDCSQLRCSSQVTRAIPFRRTSRRHCWSSPPHGLRRRGRRHRCPRIRPLP